MNQTNNSFSMHIEEEDDIMEQNKIFPEINDNKSKLLKSEEKNKENNKMMLEEKTEKTKKDNTEKKRTNKRFGTQNLNHRNYQSQKYSNFDFFQNIM